MLEAYVSETIRAIVVGVCMGVFVFALYVAATVGPSIIR